MRYILLLVAVLLLVGCTRDPSFLPGPDQKGMVFVCTLDGKAYSVEAGPSNTSLVRRMISGWRQRSVQTAGEGEVMSDRGIKWRASMPRKLPKTGMVEFVLSIKSETGARYELSGPMGEAESLALWADAHRKLPKKEDKNATPS